MIVLATVYRPGSALARFVTDVTERDPAGVVLVVDDGSGPDGGSALDAAADAGAAVIRRVVHAGKGAALKVGLAHIIDAYPGQDVVCADPDGQHRADDVCRVAARTAASGRIALGVRRFDRQVPWRRRFGNALTRRLFRAVTARTVSDTQTGLRGYPADKLAWLSGVPGEHFDYELNVLLYATRDDLPMDEITIGTVYPKDHRTSHFGALSDSLRIYWALARFAARPPLPRPRPVP